MKRLLAFAITWIAFAAVALAQGVSSRSSSTAEIDFGDVTEGKSRVASITLTNHLESPVVLVGIQTSSEEFRLDDARSTCPSNDGSLGPGESCKLTIEFLPQGPGRRAGSLTIVGSLGNSPQVVKLRGQNGPAEPSSAVTVDMSEIPDAVEVPSAQPRSRAAP